MWTDDEPAEDSADFSPPLCVTLGSDHHTTPGFIGQLSRIVSQKKRDFYLSQTPFIPHHLHMLYFNIGNGQLAGNMVDACHASGTAEGIKISGTETDEAALKEAHALLGAKNALGVLDGLDPSNSPAIALRNRFECVGGADIVIYAHGAYPGKLPSFKLPRMVERLGDMIAPYGAIVTLHNHGPSDVDVIKNQLFNLSNFSAPGVNCNTQPRLESSFGDAKLYSFSVIVPNCLSLPANLVALEAIFEKRDMQLTGQDADDARAIKQAFEKMTGGKEALAEALESVDGLAVKFFEQRIEQIGGESLPITIGGGQMVMAFRSMEIAREAFIAVQAASARLNPPAIVLPISVDIAPSFDKHMAYGEWKIALRKRGITEPPAVVQMASHQAQIGRA